MGNNSDVISSLIGEGVQLSNLLSSIATNVNNMNGLNKVAAVATIIARGSEVITTISDMIKGEDNDFDVSELQNQIKKLKSFKNLPTD